MYNREPVIEQLNVVEFTTFRQYNLQLADMERGFGPSPETENYSLACLFIPYHLTIGSHTCTCQIKAAIIQVSPRSEAQRQTRSIILEDFMHWMRMASGSVHRRKSWIARNIDQSITSPGSQTKLYYVADLGKTCNILYWVLRRGYVDRVYDWIANGAMEGKWNIHQGESRCTRGYAV